MSEEKQKFDKKRRLLIWFFITALIGTNAYTLWLLMKEKENGVRERVITEKVVVEKDNIQADLLALQKDYATLQTNDAAMQKDIDEKRAKIEELIKEAAKHKGDARIIAQLKKETETLREIMKGYVRTIDSLNTLNQTLVAEKKTVLKQLGTEKEKQQTLIKEKEELKTTIAKGVGREWPSPRQGCRAPQRPARRRPHPWRSWPADDSVAQPDQWSPRPPY